jgi:hypothetical protein
MALTKAGTALRWAILTSQAGSASPGALVTTYVTSAPPSRVGTRVQLPWMGEC